MAVIPDNIEKIPRSKYRKFVDTTPSANAPTWKILGIRSQRSKCFLWGSS